MPKFSKTSQERLATCHPDLQKLFNEVIKTTDCVIVCGHRNEIEQNKAFVEKKSKLKFPKSKHNSAPSMAVDVMPLKDGKLDWNDLKYTWEFVQIVKNVALKLNVDVTCGADWNKNNQYKDEKFLDMPHYQLD
ncbi:MAG: hypothetical protein ACRC5T_11235 [Cetobacterium sp.]